MELYDSARPLKGSPPDERDNRHRRTGGSRYSPDDTKDYAARSERSAHVCNDFLKGMCRRGSSCRYAHHGSMPDVIEKGPIEDAYRERESDHRSRDTYPDRNRDREPPKRDETPLCKFFAAGNCRNGNRCRFSHQVNKEGFSPERRSQDERQGSDHKFENDPVWDGPTWNDAARMSDIPAVQGWGEDKNEIQEPPTKEMTTTVKSGDDSWSHDIVNNKQAWDPSVGFNEPKIRDEGKPLQWKTQNGMENFSGDMEISPRDILKLNSFAPPNPQPQTLPSMPFPAVQQNTTGGTSYEKHYPHEFNEPKAFNDSYSRLNPSFKDNIPAAYQGEGRNGVGNSDNTRVTSNPSMNVPPPQSIFQSDPRMNPSVGQGQLPFPLHHSGGDGNQMQTSHNSSSFLDGNKVADGSSHFTNINASSIPSAPSTTNPNTTVSTEQLVQLSHLSASLAQLFESRQQLPQTSSGVTPPSAMSNQADPAESVPPAPDMSKQYDPISDSTEARLPNLGSHTLPSHVEQKSSDRKEPIRESGNVNHQEPVVGSSKGNENGGKVAEGGVKAPENALSEDMGVDDGGDDGKKSKDVKGMRAFKFALADFVKELLKPSWKDGHVSKEAYKTIVKKVVDKVIETLGPQIPLGKEKIDQYLSCSKPKLEKLVQAYVGKYQKGKV